LDASGNRRGRGAGISAVAPVPIPMWTSHNRLRRRCECALIPAWQLIVGPPCQSPTQCRTHQRHSIASHQTPASIRRWIKSDEGYRVLDPDLKFAYSALIDAYSHWKIALLNNGKLRGRERAKHRDWHDISMSPRCESSHMRQSHLQHSCSMQVSQNKIGLVTDFYLDNLTYFYVYLVNIDTDQEFQ
jgi:hypothetical protein